jgi:hypothetical protein
MKMKKIALFSMIFGLLFFGCDGNDNGDKFVVQTSEETNNDVETLGLVGTTVSSNKPNVATAEITGAEKIKITSVSEGIAVITVSDDFNHNATINISVSETGKIHIDTIVKYIQQIVDPFVGTWSAFVQDATIILDCDNANWIITFSYLDIQEKGTYLLPANGSGAFTITHVKNTSTGDWVTEIPQDLDPNPYGVYGITTLPFYFDVIITNDQLTLNNITFTKNEIVVPDQLIGAYRTKEGEHAEDSDYDIIITSTTLTWSGEIAVITSVTTDKVTLKYYDDVIFEHEYELNGDIFRIKDGGGAWQERKKI